MAGMIHFPDSFPLEALTMLAPIVRTGKVEDRVAAAEAAWNLLGFGMGQFLGESPDPDPARAVTPSAAKGRTRPAVPEKVTRPIAVKALESLEAVAAVPEGAQSAPVKGKDVATWAIKIAKFVLPLILGF